MAFEAYRNVPSSFAQKDEVRQLEEVAQVGRTELFLWSAYIPDRAS